MFIIIFNEIIVVTVIRFFDINLFKKLMDQFIN